MFCSSSCESAAGKYVETEPFDRKNKYMWAEPLFSAFRGPNPSWVALASRDALRLCYTLVERLLRVHQYSSVN